MKIYTKKGDKGETSLLGGAKVSKSNIRINAYGTVDELNSYMGLCRDQEVNQGEKELLIHIQETLFTIGAHLAVDSDFPKNKLPHFSQMEITALELAIDRMEEELEPMKNFILPGGHPSVSYCHIARCVCRRAERLVVELFENEPADKDDLIIIYLNRLSDYLFVLSRKMAADLKAEQIPWRPKG